MVGCRAYGNRRRGLRKAHAVRAFKCRPLLKLNKDYVNWTAGVAPADAGRAAFIRAATWADDIKNRPGYKYNKVTEPGAGRNIGYKDKLVHNYWHYYDIPFSSDGTKLQSAEEPNA